MFSLKQTFTEPKTNIFPHTESHRTCSNLFSLTQTVTEPSDLLLLMQTVTKPAANVFSQVQSQNLQHFVFPCTDSHRICSKHFPCAECADVEGVLVCPPSGLEIVGG